MNSQEVELEVRENKNKEDVIKKLLTPKDISKRIGLGMTNTYKLINLKGFPSIKIGKRIFCEEAALEKYLEDHRKTQIYLN